MPFMRVETEGIAEAGRAIGGSSESTAAGLVSGALAGTPAALSYERFRDLAKQVCVSVDSANAGIATALGSSAGNYGTTEAHATERFRR
jgi:hypothetical protein